MKTERKGWLKKAKSKIANITQQRIINSVIGSLPISEEGLRKYLLEKNVPTEFINFIVQQINLSRKNITGAIKDEVKKYISAIDISSEIQRILSNMVIEIKTEIRLVPSDKNGYKSNVKSTVNLRYDDRED